MPFCLYTLLPALWDFLLSHLCPVILLPHYYVHLPSPACLTTCWDTCHGSGCLPPPPYLIRLPLPTTTCRHLFFLDLYICYTFLPRTVLPHRSTHTFYTPPPGPCLLLPTSSRSLLPAVCLLHVTHTCPHALFLSLPSAHTPLCTHAFFVLVFYTLHHCHCTFLPLFLYAFWSVPHLIRHTSCLLPHLPHIPTFLPPPFSPHACCRRFHTTTCLPPAPHHRCCGSAPAGGFTISAAYTAMPAATTFHHRAPLLRFGIVACWFLCFAIVEQVFAHLLFTPAHCTSGSTWFCVLRYAHAVAPPACLLLCCAYAHAFTLVVTFFAHHAPPMPPYLSAATRVRWFTTHRCCCTPAPAMVHSHCLLFFFVRASAALPAALTDNVLPPRRACLTDRFGFFAFLLRSFSAVTACTLRRTTRLPLQNRLPALRARVYGAGCRTTSVLFIPPHARVSFLCVLRIATTVYYLCLHTTTINSGFPACLPPAVSLPACTWVFSSHTCYVSLGLGCKLGPVLNLPPLLHGRTRSACILPTYTATYYLLPATCLSSPPPTVFLLPATCCRFYSFRSPRFYLPACISWFLLPACHHCTLYFALVSLPFHHCRHLLHLFLPCSASFLCCRCLPPPPFHYLHTFTATPAVPCTTYSHLLPATYHHTPTSHLYSPTYYCYLSILLSVTFTPIFYILPCCLHY